MNPRCLVSHCRVRTLITLGLAGAVVAALPPLPTLAAPAAPPSAARRPLPPGGVLPASLAHRVPITLSTAFQGQNPLLPVVMQTLERNLNGVSGPKTEFDRAFDRMMAAHPQVSRAKLRQLVSGYDALPADIRSRGVAPEFLHLDARQPLSLDQVRTVFLQRHLLRPGSPRRLAGPRPPVTRAAAAAHLPLGTLLRIASAAGLDTPGSAVKGTLSKFAMTADDLNSLRLSGGKIVRGPVRGAVGGPQSSADLSRIEQMLQNADNPRLDAIVKKGPKSGLILAGSVLYLRGVNFGEQAAQNQIEIFGTLPGGFVALQTPAFAPDLVAGKGSQRELQVTLPVGLPPGGYVLKVAAGSAESNGLPLLVDQAPPPPPQISGAGPVMAGEILSLTGSRLRESQGFPVVRFSRAGQQPVDAVPVLTGLEAMTNTAVFVQVPADLAGGDYQVTFLKGESENLGLDAVSNTITLHIDPVPGPQLSPGPADGGAYSVYPDDVLILRGSNLSHLATKQLALTSTQGDTKASPPLLTPLPGGSDTSLSYRIPYGFEPGAYAARIDQTDPVTLNIQPYRYDFAFTEFDKTGPDGGHFFAVLTCIRDSEGFALTTGDRFFNEVNTQWPLGNDGVLFQNKPVYDRVIVVAQPFWYDQGNGGSDFSGTKEAISSVATLATDVSALAGEPEIGAAVTAVAQLVNDIISLFPTTAAVGPSIGKYDDPQTTQFSWSDLQGFTHAGEHTFTGQVGHVLYAPVKTPGDDPGTDYSPHGWKVFFALNRQPE